MLVIRHETPSNDDDHPENVTEVYLNVFCLIILSMALIIILVTGVVLPQKFK